MRGVGIIPRQVSMMMELAGLVNVPNDTHTEAPPDTKAPDQKKDKPSDRLDDLIVEQDSMEDDDKDSDNQ
jgi:hypothetical protein